MKTKTIQPADAGKISAVEQKHLSTIRALSARRHRIVLAFTRNLLRLDMEAGTARIEAPKVEKQSPIAAFDAVLQIIAAEEARKAGKHLRLVVDNDRVAP